MYFVLYDRNLKSIGETYILESWSRIQRAVDFDDLKIVGEQIPYSAEPYFVAVNNRQGKMMFSGLASTPSIDDKAKKTTISLKDYTTLFNTDIVIHWGNFKGSSLADYLDFTLNEWSSQTYFGFDGKIEWDLRGVSDIMIDSDIPLPTETENILFYTIVSDAINYYSIWCEPVLDLFKKTLTFTFKRSSMHKNSISLKDFGVDTIEKSFGDYNLVTVRNADYTVNQKWVLAKSNAVRLLENVNDDDRPYPLKNRNYVLKEDEEDPNSIVYDAVMGLSKNRYQENIDLNVQQYKSLIDLTSADFSWDIDVYTDEGFYKTLPVGEIETDSNGRHIVRLGYRIQELTQEL